MKVYTDIDAVKALVNLHLAPTLEPALSTEEVDLLIDTAKSDAGEWTTASINRIVSRGWQAKASRALSEYDKLGGGPGIVLERSKLYDRCMARAAAYAPGGGASVDDDPDALEVQDTYIEIFPFLTGDSCGEALR